jgi:alcohol dehydrogenase, propanol-preferring
MSPPEIPSTARAVVIKEFHKPLVVEANHPVPSPSSLRAGECLVKIEYAGCCHSDIHVRDGGWGTPVPIPIIGGHEGVGRIVAIGGDGSYA